MAAGATISERRTGNGNEPEPARGRKHNLLNTGQQMKEASRIQAVIEALEEILQDKRPADNILDKYFKDRRYIGSKDRRFIADTVWKIIRNRMKYAEALGSAFSARTAAALCFAQEDPDLLFNGEEYAPAPLNKEEKAALKAAEQFEDFSETAPYECA